MFSRNRYVTARISEEVPFILQMLMWACIDMLGNEADYLQVFEFKEEIVTPEEGG